MERDSMVFYRSFRDAIKALPQEEQLKALWALIDYGLDGTDPEGMGAAQAIVIMARPQINANNKRYESGKKGGRPRKSDGDTSGSSASKKTKAPNKFHNFPQRDTDYDNIVNQINGF